ncbi:MAG: polysaccharide biosynthesis protein [Oscillospiraceae bacterium]|nr:polysaccharide biosynthesis protein [Oscillospiraceae bacterium]
MSNKKEVSFVKGALILAVASVLVKVIGAVFRVPLTNLVGEYTMGLYSMAYRYYSILLTIATAGIPIAISKMISESRALSRARETKRIFNTAISLCAGIGIVGMLVLVIFAKPLALATNDINAVPSIVALAPAVLFMAVTAGFRGYFQGHENMVPTALSQIIEALSRLFVGLYLAWLLMSRGFEEKYISASIIMGITLGTVLTVSLMLFFKARKNKKEIKLPKNPDEIIRSRSGILSALLKIAIPVTLGSLVMNITSTIDMFLITNRLALLGYNSEMTTSLFGIYENYALPLFNLVPSIIISLNVSVTPTISAAYAVGDREKLHKTLLSALRIVIIFTLPASVGISVLAKPILSILFKSAADVAIAAPVLSILGVASFFLCASSLTSTSMQALGRATVPLLTMLCGAVVKIVANYILIAIPGVELSGAAIGTVLCYIVITVLNMFFLVRTVGFKPKFIETYIRPIICCALMGVVVWFAYSLTLPFAGNLVSVAVSIAAGIVVYFASMILLRGITRDDISGLPKGEKIAAKLFRDK